MYCEKEMRLFGWTRLMGFFLCQSILCILNVRMVHGQKLGRKSKLYTGSPYDWPKGVYKRDCGPSVERIIRTLQGAFWLHNKTLKMDPIYPAYKEHSYYFRESS